MFNIDRKYNSDILLYCEINNIQDINSFVTKCFKQGFNIEKYGLLGKSLNEGEKDLKIDGEQEKRVEIEVIVEKRVEVPVEIIKEVEKIVEVPVDRIVEIEKIVEVPVEVIKEVEKIVEVEKVVTKIEYISDKSGEKDLIDTINTLQDEMSKKDKNLDELRRTLDELLAKPPVEIIKEVEVIKEIEKPNDKVNLLQQTIQNLTTEVRELKKKNEELENKLKNQPTQLGDIPAKFFGGSNLKL